MRQRLTSLQGVAGAGLVTGGVYVAAGAAAALIAAGVFLLFGAWTSR